MKYIVDKIKLGVTYGQVHFTGPNFYFLRVVFCLILQISPLLSRTVIILSLVRQKNLKGFESNLFNRYILALFVLSMSSKSRWMIS